VVEVFARKCPKKKNSGTFDKKKMVKTEKDQKKMTKTKDVKDVSLPLWD
jgi:hypothetical protein